MKQVSFALIGKIFAEVGRLGNWSFSRLGYYTTTAKPLDNHQIYNENI